MNRKQKTTVENRSKKGDRTGNIAVYVSWCFAGNGVAHRRQGKEEGRGLLQTPLFVWIFWRRRVNPRAASGGGAWRRRAATVQPTQRLHNAVPVVWSLRHCSGF